MVVLSPLNCPVCGAPMPDASASCAYCGSLLGIRMDHPRLDPALLHRARIDELIDGLRARIRRDPADAAARYGLGVACFSLGLIDESAAELQQAVRLEPEHPGIRVQFAVVLAELDLIGVAGARDRAWRELRAALSLAPRDPEGLLLAARLHADAGDWSDALRVLRPALGAAPEVNRRAADLFLGRAAMLAARERWLDAASLWREAAAIDPVATSAMLREMLRDQQETLLGPPRFSRLARPPASRSPGEWGRAAAFVLMPGAAAFAVSMLLSQWDATIPLALVFCALTLLLPLAILWRLRRERRAAAAPALPLITAIRRDPAAFFRGEPGLDSLLAAADFVAAERQGRAILAENAWLSGGRRRAARAASLRAPWMPSGGDPH
ncbi:MAG: tetratricopeptide repeat protein [Chloroflexota bacterium]